MLFGGIGVAVVIAVFVVMSGDKPADAKDTPKPPAPAAVAPAAAPAQPGATPAVAKAGKTPAKPAPALTPEMMQEARALLQQAKDLNNEGVKARTAGDNTTARAKQSEANDKLEALQKLIAAPLAWQEEADFGDWTQPAEYVALGKLFQEVSNLMKRVRMGGGTR